MKQTQTKHLFFSMGLIACLSLASLAFAEGEGSISIDPIKETIEAQAGEQKTSTLVITNGTEDAKDITISFVEFTVNENGVPSAVESSDENSPALWFGADSTETSIAASEEKQIALTINVPASAEAKGYYVMASIGIASTDAQTGSNETKQEIQSLYSLVVGSPEATLAIAQMIPTDDFVTIVVQNSSNVHAQVSGKLDVLLADEVVETYSIEGTNVFPGKNRNIIVSIDELEGTGYVAKASLVYGAENTIITAEQSFDQAVDASESTTIKNTATVVSDTKLANQDYLIYALLGIGAVLIVLGIVLTIKKK